MCDAGAMAAAARQLGQTQPAVSQTIAELEARTGALLFDRSVRPLALTPAGALLRQRASALLAEARQIAPLLRDSASARLPLVRVGLVDSLARALAQPIAGALAGVADSVAVWSGFTAAHAGALLTRNLDLFIGVDELADIDGLERWPLMREPYVLIAPDGYAPLDDLAALAAQAPLIRFSARSRTGVDIDRHLRRLGLAPPRSLEFDTPLGVAAAVAAGRGFALTTPLCLFEAGHLAHPALSCAPLPGPAFGRRLTLVARRQELGRAPRLVAECGRAALREGVAPALEAALPWLGEAFAIN